MIRATSLSAIVAAALSTAGCATFEGAPRPVTSTMANNHLTEGEAIQKQIDAADGDPLKQRAIRNNAVWAYVRAADDQYRQFLASINKTVKGSNFGLDLAGVLVSSAGAVANGAANELSAAAAALTGARGSINRELYFEKTLPAIEAAMQANRLRVKTQIATHLINDDVARYPLQQALADLGDYELAASLNAAIQEITTTSGNAANQEQRRYENATESCEPTNDVAPLWGSINDVVMMLEEAAKGGPAPAGSDRAKKLHALSVIHEMVTGNSVADAANEAEAEAQAKAIILSSQKFCTRASANALLADIAAKTGVTP
ncbi:MAG: hypothetical protein QOJ94_3301 [Sphingomonadales bacterium]|jgi:hypothetical protein|nr:hypothetical protein [Sphingomonadales bacterium]